MIIHIGEKIKTILEKRAISKSELGRRLNMSSTNVHKIFKRETIDTGLLQKISFALDHDFFQYYAVGNAFNEGTELYKVKNKEGNESFLKLASEVDACKKEIELLKLEMSQKEVLYLKRINELLEKK